MGFEASAIFPPEIFSDIPFNFFIFPSGKVAPDGIEIHADDVDVSFIRQIFFEIFFFFDLFQSSGVTSFCQREGLFLSSGRRRIALSVNGNEPNVRGSAVLSSSGNIEITLGCCLKKSCSVNLALPEGFKVESIEFMNKLNPKFARMKKWDFQIDGSTASFPKSEEPEFFFISLIPEQ